MEILPNHFHNLQSPITSNLPSWFKKFHFTIGLSQFICTLCINLFSIWSSQSFLSFFSPHDTDWGKHGQLVSKWSYILELSVFRVMSLTCSSILWRLAPPTIRFYFNLILFLMWFILHQISTWQCLAAHITVLRMISLWYRKHKFVYKNFLHHPFYSIFSFINDHCPESIFISYFLILFYSYLLALIIFRK